MTETSAAHRADVTREDGWWMIRIPHLDLTTQAETWAQVESMARGVIAADQDLAVADITVDLHAHPDPGTAELLDEARTKAGDADRLRAESLAANQAAARRLHADGWSYRLIGRVMSLTYQRVEQLVKGDTQRSRTGVIKASSKSAKNTRTTVRASRSAITGRHTTDGRRAAARADEQAG